MTESHQRSDRRILIVDDEIHILQVLSLKLRNAGYDVLTAVDGEEALEIVTHESPDLVITDYQMPYLTGLELCQKMAAREQTSTIPVLILTARGYSLNDTDLEIGNIKHVVHKPFSPRAILVLVEEMLAQSAVEHGENKMNRAA